MARGLPCQTRAPLRRLLLAIIVLVHSDRIFVGERPAEAENQHQAQGQEAGERRLTKENCLGWLPRDPTPMLPDMGSDPKARPQWSVSDNRERSRFEIDLGDSRAVAEYTLPTGMIMFTHTEVPSQHEGKGVGSALIRAGLASARERGLKVIPICPFFAAYMKKHQEEQDLLDSTWRARLGAG